MIIKWKDIDLILKINFILFVRGINNIRMKGRKEK